jgi:Tfp pilus assembly protein PilN
MLSMGTAAGIQILPDKMVFVSLKKGLQDYSIKHSVVIEGFRELPPAEMKSKLRQRFPSDGISRQNMVLGLPAEEVTLRLVELPLDVEENLDQVVRFQIEKFEPAEEEESYFDYVVLSRDEEQKKILLQIGMVRQSVLDEYLETLEELDLDPAVARLSSLGLHQILALHADGFPKKEPVVILEASPGSLEMVVVVSPERFFSEKLYVDTEQLDADRIIREVYAFLLRLPLKTETLGRIYTAGPLDHQILDLLRQRFSDCEALTDKLSLKEGDTVRNRPELLPAIGLAASALAKAKKPRLNLIPPGKRIIEKKPSMIPTIVLVALLLLLVGVAATRGYRQSSLYRDGLDAEIRRLQPRVEEVHTLRQQVETKKKELNDIRGLMTGEQEVLLVMQDLTDRLPEDTYLQNLNIERGQVALFGFSSSAQGLVQTLRASPYFKSVSSKYITKDVTTKKDRFNIEAVLKEQAER